MTSPADAVTGTPAAPNPSRDAGPHATLQVLRVVAVLHSLAFLAQPVFAGGYLMGDIDSLATHTTNAFLISAIDLVQLICAIVFFWKGRGPAWPIWASLAIAVAVEVQIGMGYTRELVVHLPLGVSLITGQILATVWLFRAAAVKARAPRVARPERAS